MGIFSRLFKIGQAETNAVIDKMEDPVKMTDQAIRDMKVDLEKSLQALAEVKALAIRTRSEAENYKAKAVDYEQKAMLLLQRAQEGQMQPAEAERLAQMALDKKEEAAQAYARTSADQQKLDAQVAKLNSNVTLLRDSISKWENEAKMLKARSKVAEATKNVNKQMANIDSSGTVAMLERMKQKVEANEALSEAYGDIADTNKSVDTELNSALGASKSTDALAALKAKMGLTTGTQNQLSSNTVPPPPTV